MVQVTKSRVKNESSIFFIENPEGRKVRYFRRRSYLFSEDSSMEDDGEDEGKEDSCTIGL